MANLPIELDDVPDEVIYRLIQNVNAKDLLAKQQATGLQHQIAAQTGAHRALDGFGRMRLNIEPTAFHYWGRRLGYECWRDKQFLNEFERDNPAARVTQNGGTKLQFGYVPAASPRSRQTYDLSEKRC